MRKPWGATIAATVLLLPGAAGAAGKPHRPAPARATGSYVYDTCAGVAPGSGRVCETHRVVAEVALRRIAAGGPAPAVAAAAADAEHPFGIFLKVSGPPGRRAAVTWAMTCTASSGAARAAGAHGTYATRSAGRHYLPITVADADRCSARASATTRRGPVRLQIFAEVPGKLISDTVIASSGTHGGS